MTPLSPDELLSTTRAVRKRLDLSRPVPREVVEDCLRLAFQAPNGSNAQTWAWILVDDPPTRAAMAELYRQGLADHGRRDRSRDAVVDRSTPASARMSESVAYLLDNLQRVPVLLVPTIDQRYAGASTFELASRWGSILPAVWSFMLALRSRGLGSAWTTLHLYREQAMAELLHIPADHTQVGLFPVAYTIGTDFKPGDRSASMSRIFWNRGPG
ncbi:MAG TPA: nitroreductase family protein [Acidimicrobiales bacterium]|jgi:nitroreductase|nr:nitroreductase family protein [Acidimicrobiales bacterium]